MIEFGADRETQEFAKTTEAPTELTAEALAVILGAVPIVRCKDCKHWARNGGPYVRMCMDGPCAERYTPEHFYCWHGTKRGK